jgi:hypothetical protein
MNCVQFPWPALANLSHSIFLLKKHFNEN